MVDGPLQGLEYYEAALTPLWQEQVLAWIKHLPFKRLGRGEASRRYQHYGFEYNYKSRRAKRLGPLPEIFQSVRNLIKDLRKDRGLPEVPDEYWDQCIVNEYEPGQQITWHTDADIFGDMIACFTLGDPEVMRFRIGGLTEEITPAAGSLYLMKDGSRHIAQHCMKKKKQGGTRYSVTFRHVGTKD